MPARLLRQPCQPRAAYPLTSIHSNAQLLEEWGLEDDKIGPESVAAIRRESERMRGLIEGLLELTRGDEGSTLRLERQDLAAVANETAEAARAVANGRVTIEHTSFREPVDAVFDREGLRQAISILLDNAVKYTPQGGRIILEVAEEPDAVIVSDSGIGKPEDQLHHVFERFYRADEARSTQGSGLGLAIARQIVEDYGGSVRARSRPAEGSTFAIRIPPAGTETGPPPFAPGVPAPCGGPGCKIVFSALISHGVVIKYERARLRF